MPGFSSIRVSCESLPESLVLAAVSCKQVLPGHSWHHWTAGWCFGTWPAGVLVAGHSGSVALLQADQAGLP